MACIVKLRQTEDGPVYGVIGLTDVLETFAKHGVRFATGVSKYGKETVCVIVNNRRAFMFDIEELHRCSGDDVFKHFLAPIAVELDQTLP